VATVPSRPYRSPGVSSSVRNVGGVRGEGSGDGAPPPQQKIKNK